MPAWRVRKISSPNGIGSSECPSRSESQYRLSHQTACTPKYYTKTTAIRKTHYLEDHSIVLLHVSNKNMILSYTVLHPCKCHWQSGKTMAVTLVNVQHCLSEEDQLLIATRRVLLNNFQFMYNLNSKIEKAH